MALAFLFFFSFIYPIQFIRSFWSVQSVQPSLFFCKTRDDRNPFFFFFFERKSFNLWRPLLMIALYHQTKTPISFWCRRGLNLRSLIQPSETLPIELARTHKTHIFLNALVDSKLEKFQS